MAVPPAPDGDAVGDPSDSSDTTPSAGSAGNRYSRWILAGAVAVIIGCVLASLVALGRAGWSFDDLADEPVNPQQQREEMMAAAQRFVTALDSYGPEDLDEKNQMTAYADRVEKLVTAKAFTSFEPSLAITALGVAQGRFTSEAKVYAVGVASMDEDSGRILVAGTVTLSQPAPKAPKKQVVLDRRTARFEVVVIRTGGQWVVDDYGAAGTLDQPTGPTPSSPTPPSPTPSSEPSNKGGGR